MLSDKTDPSRLSQSRASASALQTARSACPTNSFSVIAEEKMETPRSSRKKLWWYAHTVERHSAEVAVDAEGTMSFTFKNGTEISA